jgi:hypothetical protein
LALALIGGEWPVSCSGHFTPEERAPGTHWIGGWVGPRTSLDDMERSYWVSDIRQVEIHIAEPLVPEHNPFEVEIVIAKLEKYKLPGSDQILAELIQAGGEILWSEVHIFINSIWSKEELPEQGKESIIGPIYKKGDTIDCSNYRGISLLSTAYKILLSILSRLNPYIDEITGDHQCGF